MKILYKKHMLMVLISLMTCSVQAEEIESDATQSFHELCTTPEGKYLLLNRMLERYETIKQNIKAKYSCQEYTFIYLTTSLTSCETLIKKLSTLYEQHKEIDPILLHVLNADLNELEKFITTNQNILSTQPAKPSTPHYNHSPNTPSRLFGVPQGLKFLTRGLALGATITCIYLGWRWFDKTFSSWVIGEDFHKLKKIKDSLKIMEKKLTYKSDKNPSIKKMLEDIKDLGKEINELNKKRDALQKIFTNWKEANSKKAEIMIAERTKKITKQIEKVKKKTEKDLKNLTKKFDAILDAINAASKKVALVHKPHKRKPEKTPSVPTPNQSDSNNILKKLVFPVVQRIETQVKEFKAILEGMYPNGQDIDPELAKTIIAKTHKHKHDKRNIEEVKTLIALGKSRCIETLENIDALKGQ